jgi:hypothetical protein
MDIAPQSLPQLQGRHNPAGIGQQQPQRSQFFGRKVNRRFAAQKSAVGFQTKAPKRYPRLFKARQSGSTLLHPNQRSSSDSWSTSRRCYAKRPRLCPERMAAASQGGNPGRPIWEKKMMQFSLEASMFE